MAYPMQEQTAGSYFPPQEQYPEPIAPYPPPEQQGYPGQQQPAYPPPQANAPPPYFPGQQPTQPSPYPQQQFAAQQTTSNVTVVQSQPQPVVYQPQRYAGSAGTCAMVFAIVLTFFAFFSGCLWALVCSVPAILFAVSANNASSRGEVERARSNEKISIGCSIFGVIFGVLGLVAIVGGVVAWYVTVVFSFSRFNG
ncbi:cysteine-rich and transmembrane domain-containing protein 1-like isoform X3 [Halichondria panicea]|uniref:cysteine-rich and transmembrane domain-containing protein 1-like isoform X3 n=1 Tax=Halichondria panicea TaxID=6063 RepID=UPI00312B6D1A